MDEEALLMKLEGDAGARRVLDGSGEDTFYFMSSDLGTVKDIDVKSDILGL